MSIKTVFIFFNTVVLGMLYSLYIIAAIIRFWHIFAPIEYSFLNTEQLSCSQVVLGIGTPLILGMLGLYFLREDFTA